MNVTLERNTDFNQEELPYFARVEIVAATAEAGRIYRVPVRVRHIGLKKEFWLELCGFRIQVPHPQQLPSLIHSLLRGLVHSRRLPTYVFIARRARSVFPVYTLGSEVFVPAPSGPVFRHVELAKVREYLTDYLHEIGILGEKGLSDKLHVRGIGREDLGLRRPVFYLKKRQLGQTDFWAPVFPAHNGQCIYAYAADQRREEPLVGGLEVERLRDQVAVALMGDGRLQDRYDLRADRLLPPVWEQLARHLDWVGQEEIAGTPIAFYRGPAGLLAMEARPKELRFGLFHGADIEEIRRRVKMDLNRRQQ